jgi:hypothetical protein
LLALKGVKLLSCWWCLEAEDVPDEGDHRAQVGHDGEQQRVAQQVILK